MIDPKNITNFFRTQRELLEFLIFGIAVAGKSSLQVAPKINALTKERAFWQLMDNAYVGGWDGRMRLLLQKHKIGNYTRMTRVLKSIAFWEDKDLTKITLEQLLWLHGVGPKTACFFLLHSRPNQDVLVLDTHIRKWLAERGLVVKAIADKDKYLEFAKTAIPMIKAAFPTTTLHDADLQIWKQYARGV